MLPVERIIASRSNQGDLQGYGRLTERPVENRPPRTREAESAGWKRGARRHEAQEASARARQPPGVRAIQVNRARISLTLYNAARPRNLAGFGSPPILLSRPSKTWSPTRDREVNSGKWQSWERLS